MTLRNRISLGIIGYGIVLVLSGGVRKVFTTARGWAHMDAAAEGPRFYEIQCRAPSKCGTFVSVRPLDVCPKCGSSKVVRRAAEATSKTKI